jgi:hypothetical protein
MNIKAPESCHLIKSSSLRLCDGQNYIEGTCAILLCVAAVHVGGIQTLLKVDPNVGVLYQAEKRCFHLRPHTQYFPVYGSIYISRLASAISWCHTAWNMINLMIH